MHPVIKIAADLALEGKEPSMALVKTRLEKPLPVLEVINELKRYKASPAQYQEQVKNHVSTANTDIEKNKGWSKNELSLQEQINFLKQELDKLKLAIADLKQNN